MSGRIAVAVVAFLMLACGGLVEEKEPPPPVPPRDVRAVWGDGVVELSWSAAPNADRYRVYRASACAGPWSLRARTSQLSFTDSEVQNGETYFFAVSTVEDGEEGRLSIEVRGEPGVAPVAPLGVVAIAGEGRVDLSWLPVAGATRYRVDRADAVTGPFHRVGYSDEAAFASTGLAATEHHFVVVALAGSAEGPASAVVQAAPSEPAGEEDPSLVQSRGFDGIVTAIVPADDGSGDVWVGGSFAHYGSSLALGVARLRDDGSPDPLFSSPPLIGVADIVRTVDSSGDVFVASATGILRLNSDGSEDGSFDAEIGAGEYGTRLAAARDGSGGVYVTGGLIGASIRRLNADGSRDDSFTSYIPLGSTAPVLLANEDGTLWVGTGNILMRLDRNGNLDDQLILQGESLSGAISSLAFVDEGCRDFYAGGPFSGASVLRIRENGRVHEGFAPPPILLTIVTGIASAGDEFGEIYVSGFTGPASPPSPIVRYEADGALDPDFPVRNFAYYVTTLATALDGSGDVFAGGWFLGYEGTGVDRFARLNSDGTVDPGTRTGSGLIGHMFGFASDVAVAPDGSGDVFVAGSFTYYDGKPAYSLARIGADGVADEAFAPYLGTQGSPQSTYIAPALDGSGDVYAASSFGDSIVRLDADGMTDSGFTVATFDAAVSAIAPLADGTLYVGGAFGLHGTQPAGRIVHLLPTGVRDFSFDTGSGFDQAVHAVLPAGDGTGDVYVGGGFTGYDGSTSAKRIVRLNADGSIDAGFAIGAGFDGDVLSLALAGDGTGDLYVGGSFTTYRGSAVPRVIRVRADGTREPTFQPSISSSVTGIAPALDGTADVWVVDAERHLRRLDADGGDDASFDPGEGLGGAFSTVGGVSLVALADSSGRVVVGGSFTSYRGATVDGLVRVNSDGTMD